MATTLQEDAIPGAYGCALMKPSLDGQARLTGVVWKSLGGDAAFTLLLLPIRLKWICCFYEWTVLSRETRCEVVRADVLPR